MLWLNLGDSYANDQKWGGHPSGKHRKELHTMMRPERFTGLPGKNLLMIPARVAIALQEDGWILRQDCIWQKPTAMPESVTDRPTTAHEHLFLLAKSERYFYDADAIREPTQDIGRKRKQSTKLPALQGDHGVMGHDGNGMRMQAVYNHHPLGRNKRSVWTVASQPFEEAHFATFPPKLIEPCILVTCIRQTGIQRQPDGTITYTFVAQVSKELAPVMIALKVSVGGEVQAQAKFDEAMHASLVESTPVLENGRGDVARRRA